MFKKRIDVTRMGDADLVLSSLGGNRNAFCEIVTRYQNLLCSLAFSSVGDLKYSEDIAQEVFVEAWKKLDTLKDPAKLKSWLCGILRFKVGRFFRKETHQPTRQASDIDEITAELSEQAKLEDNAIDEQHQQLLWQTLEAMPENYREPLILFYREQKSVESVAKELDLTKEVAKQRLSRGRKKLQEAMVQFVDDALAKSKPGAAFTLAVMTAISTISPPAKASAFSVAAVKTGSFFKATAILAFVASISGLVSSFFGLRAGLDQSRTERERRSTIKFVSLFLGSVALFALLMLGLRFLAVNTTDYLVEYAILSQVVVFAFVIYYCRLTARVLVEMRTMRAEERLFNPDAFDDPTSDESRKKREYKSRLTIAGIPLFHFRFDVPEENDGPVIGWVAGGDRAYGVIFAWGLVAIAPISVGVISVGLLSVGAIGFGVIGIGTVAFGVASFGASAIGYTAFSSLSALGWQNATSFGFSIAKEGALGGIAIAEQVNNEAAMELANLSIFENISPWLNLFIALVVIIPAAWYARTVRKRLADKHHGAE